LADSPEITVTMTLLEARMVLRVLERYSVFDGPALRLSDRKELYRGESKIRAAFNGGCRKLTGEPEAGE